MNWKRFRDGSAWRVLATLVILALVVVQLGLTGSGVGEATAAIDALDALPRASLRAPVAGPAVYVGRMYGPAARESYARNASAAYAGWITETTGSGRNQRTTRLCGPLGEVDQLTLAADGAAVPLAVFPSLRWARLYESGTLDLAPTRGVLDLGRVNRYDFVPGALSAQCGTSYRYGRLAYYEATVPPDAPVSVVACFDGSSLAPCGNGREMLAVNGFGRITQGWAAKSMLPVRVLGSIVAVLLAVLGFASLRHLVRLDRGRAAGVGAGRLR